MFEWDDFLALAEELAARPNDEAAYRSAISRAYYATFHASRDYLARTGIPLQRTRFAHLQVQNELRRRSEELGDYVERLHSWRKEADYENPCSFDVAGQAVSATALARRTIEQIKAIT